MRKGLYEKTNIEVSEDSDIERQTSNFDNLVKSRKAPVVVIPAKAGIQ